MTKRRKLRTSGEGIHTPRPPKNPRLGDSAGAPRSSQVGHVPHPEELEGSPGQAPSAEQSREEPEQSASSSPEEEAGAPSRLLGQPDEEPAPFPPSQNSVGRFVPQFAKPRRTVRRQAAMREEDLGSGACGSLFPVGSGLAPCWPGPGPRADGGPLTGAQLRALCGVKACEAARMEDATDTVHGLILELSNLNRLVMSTHRDLEAIRRLPSRRARPARKGPAPCTAKAVGGLHRGEQSWRDV
uniref:Break repair meiotic recombinase recruitment factor 1 n=1 Tax=Equus caballus TaxID=9796 RepID=A0A3Q2HQM1_HORSE